MGWARTNPFPMGADHNSPTPPKFPNSLPSPLSPGSRVTLESLYVHLRIRRLTFALEITAGELHRISGTQPAKHPPRTHRAFEVVTLILKVELMQSSAPSPLVRVVYKGVNSSTEKQRVQHIRQVAHSLEDTTKSWAYSYLTTGYLTGAKTNFFSILSKYKTCSASEWHMENKFFWQTIWSRWRRCSRQMDNLIEFPWYVSLPVCRRLSLLFFTLISRLCVLAERRGQLRHIQPPVEHAHNVCATRWLTSLSKDSVSFSSLVFSANCGEDRSHYWRKAGPYVLVCCTTQNSHGERQGRTSNVGLAPFSHLNFNFNTFFTFQTLGVE